MKCNECDNMSMCKQRRVPSGAEDHAPNRVPPHHTLSSSPPTPPSLPSSPHRRPRRGTTRRSPTTRRSNCGRTGASYSPHWMAAAARGTGRTSPPSWPARAPCHGGRGGWGCRGCVYRKAVRSHQPPTSMPANSNSSKGREVRKTVAAVGESPRCHCKATPVVRTASSSSAGRKAVGQMCHMITSAKSEGHSQGPHRAGRAL